MLTVALEGIQNILECGEKHYMNLNGENPFVIIMHTKNHVDDLQDLQ